MKSKRTIMTLSILVAIMLTVVGCIFASTAEKEEDATDFDLNGVWRVAIFAQEPQPEDKYLVFNDGALTYYPGNNGSEIVSSYEVKGDKLTAVDLKKEMSIVPKTSNVISLIESGDGPYWELVRVPYDTVKPGTIVEQGDFIGEWTVLLHGGDTKDEQLILDEQGITLYRGNDTTPYFSGTYIWQEPNVIYVDQLKLKMTFYSLSENAVTMVEEGPNYIWEIVRK